MKALTIQEPWAWAIVDLAELTSSAKNVENRGPTFPLYYGKLLIHSGSGKLYYAGWEHYRREIYRIVCRVCPDFDSIAGRGLIGWVELAVGVRKPAGRLLYVEDRITERFQPYHMNWRAAGDWAEGPTCLLLGGVHKFAQPIPYRGQQGLFNVPDEVVADAIAKTKAAQP